MNDMNGARCLRAGLISVALFAVLSAVFVTAASSQSIATTERTEHGPIMIDSDSEFTSANGVVSGNGTKSDPYIIEGWNIGPSPNITAIDIHKTNAYFRVRNVYVISCSIGVVMNSVHNGMVESSQFINCSIGVAVFHSDNCKVTSNTFEGSHIAISISYSDVSQSDNTFVNNGVNVTRLKNTLPWEMTWVGAAVCVAIFIPLVAIIAILLYFRFKRIPPPVP